MSNEAAEDSVSQFVEDLRQLWIDDGKRPFTALARRTGVGKSTLNEAVTKLDRLPSERTVRALIEVLAPDLVDDWVNRRELLLTPRAVPPHREEAASAEASSVTGTRRNAIVAGLLMTVAVAGFLTGRITTPEKTVASDSRPRGAADGSDPINAGCVPDAGTIASTTDEDLGTLRLIFSTECNAYWAKIERHDGLSIGNKLDVAVFERGGQGREQRAQEPDLTSAYTFVLKRPDAVTAVCARGAVWVGETRHELPDAC